MVAEHIEKAVKREIESREKLGDRAGGSGHLGHVTYEIVSMETTPFGADEVEVRYQYRLQYLTEFELDDDVGSGPLKSGSFVIAGDGGATSSP